MKFGLRMKFASYLLVMLLIVSGNYLLFLRADKQSEEKETWVIHTLEVLHKSEVFLGHLKDAETGQRGFLLTADRNYLEPFELGTHGARQAYEELKNLTNDNPVQQSRLNTIRLLMIKKLQELQETIDLTFQGKSGQAMTNVLQGEGKALMDKIRQQMEQFKAEEQRLLAERVKQVEEQQGLIQTMFAIEAIVLIAVILGHLVLVQATLVRPLSRLTRRAQEFEAGKGDMVEKTSRGDEIGELANAMRKMQFGILRNNAELEAMTQYEKTFSEVLSACVATHDLPKAFDKALGLHGRGHNCLASAIYLLDNETQTLKRIADNGVSTQLPEGFRVGEGLLGQVFSDQKQRFIAQKDIDGFTLQTGLGEIIPQTLVVQPILHRDSSLGVAVFAYARPVDEPMQSYLDNLGLQFGLAAVNSAQYDTLKSLTSELEASRRKAMAERDAAVKVSITDPLTGLHNRGFLEVEMERMLAAAMRYDNHLAVIMLDIDHFKRVNDTFGHQAGDTVLANLGAQLKLQLRSTDLIVRFGGEEFIVVMPDTSEATAVELAEKLRQSIEGLEMACLKGRNVTISLGISIFPEDGKGMASLIRNADEALYAAKGAGRNRVMLSSKTTDETKTNVG